MAQRSTSNIALVGDLSSVLRTYIRRLLMPITLAPRDLMASSGLYIYVYIYVDIHIYICKIKRDS